MSSFDKLEQSIKKKMALQDYKMEIQQNVEEVKTAKSKKVEKFKLTIYLNEEEMDMLNEICCLNIKKKWKPDKSAIFSEALRLLFNSLSKKL